MLTENLPISMVMETRLPLPIQIIKVIKRVFPHQKINHLRFTSNNYFLLKSGTINADFAFQNNKRREFGDATNPNDTELYFDLNTFNYNVRYNLKRI